MSHTGDNLKNKVKSSVKTILGIIELSRPFDGIIVGSAVVLGMILGILTIPPLDKALLGFIMGVLLLGGMDAYNDYRDLEIDRISKPWRPLPRGAVKPRVALIAAVIETGTGVLIAILLDVSLLLVVFISVGLAYLYSRR